MVSFGLHRFFYTTSRYSTLKRGSATPFDLVPTASQVGEKVAHLLLHRGPGAQAQVGSHVLAHPAPDGLISIEVWTVTGQVDQAQVQAGRGEVGS